MIKYIKFWGTVLLLIALSCNNNKNPTRIPPNRPEGWISMGLDDNRVGRLRLHDNYLYACTFDSGLFRINTNGNDAEWEYLGLKYAVYDVVVLHDSIVVCRHDGIYRSTENGMSWLISNSGIGPYKLISTLAQSPHNPKIVLAGNFSAQIFISNNFGKSWLTSYDPSQGLGWGLSTDVIRFHSQNIEEAWAGATSNGEYPILIQTKDLGQTWNTAIDWNQSPEGENQLDYILSIAFDPFQKNTLYVGMRRVWKSIDNGKTWTEFLDVIPDSLAEKQITGIYYGIEINPENNTEIWISENHGLFYTIDWGQSWEENQKPEGIECLSYIAVDWKKRILYVSNYGYGVHKLYF